MREKVKMIYGVWAVMFCNFVILFVLLNILVYVVVVAKDRYREESGNRVIKKYGYEKIELVYPNMTKKDIRELLHETWENRLVYEPFTSFREPICTGRYVNVVSPGIRTVRNQEPWPASSTNCNIFMFGGSTTFGYGVSDDQTIASYLQVYLRRHTGRNVFVYNFGHGFYYSSQERVLFERLLTAGMTPNVVVFLDGLNDFCFFDDRPMFSDRLASSMNRTGGLVDSLSDLPLVKAVKRLAESTCRSEPKRTFMNSELSRSVLDRYIRNIRIIESVSERFGIRPLFVWQPVPIYNYDLHQESFAVNSEIDELIRQGYAQMNDLKKNLESNFVWCADIQKGERTPLYVDSAHYGPALSEKIAARIGQEIVSQQLFCDKPCKRECAQ